MTVGKFFGYIFKILLGPIILYWAYIYYFSNNANDTFKHLFLNTDWMFPSSFVALCMFATYYTVCFLVYSIENKDRSLAITYSWSYIKENFWDDVNQFFSL